MMERILVVLPNWYGEILFATPFLKALRQHRPNALIATLGWPQSREILLHNPRLNEVLVFDDRGEPRGFAGWWHLARELRRLRFDRAFILRKSLSRTLLLCAAGIPHRIGFDNSKSGWALTARIPAPRTPQHKAASYLPLLSAIGATASLQPYEYVVSEAERRAARETCLSLFPKKVTDTFEQPLVVLHPGANWAHKRWAPERFGDLGDRLSTAFGAQVLLTGGPEDLALAQAVRASMQRPATVLAGATSVRELAAILEHADLVVSNDTGIAHLAAALHRPLVALYGPTSPALTGPLGDRERVAVIHRPECCPQIPCYAPNHASHPGMQAISVDEVYEAAHRLLQNTHVS